MKLTGPDGLPKALTKPVIETVDEEMAEHSMINQLRQVRARTPDPLIANGHDLIFPARRDV